MTFNRPSAIVRRRCVTLLSLTALASAAGCAGSGSGPIASEGASREQAVARPESGASAADIAFVDAMIGYSRLNARLAELDINNGSRPSMQEMAVKVRREESTTLDFLMAERARLGVARALPSMQDDPHAASDDRRMSAAAGDDADAFFAEHMIKHSLDAAKCALAASTDLSSANLRYYAQSVPEDASRRLRELRAAQAFESEVPRNARAGLRGYQGTTNRSW
jgi:uncharacterized protein (DUF305 family)